MAPTTRAPLIEHLPGVLRSDVLERFLAAFETLQRQVEHEVERIPDLFSVVPTAVLAADVTAGPPTLCLDSAAGLRPGDLLELADAEASRAEFVVVRDLHVALRAGVRAEPVDGPFSQPAGEPLWELRSGAASRLAAVADAGSESLTLPAPAALPVAEGTLVRVGDEDVRVARVRAEQLELAAPLARDHVLGAPVAVLEHGAVAARLLEPATLERRLLRLEARPGGIVAGTALELGRRYLVVESLVVEAPGELAPRLVSLEASPRFPHRLGTPIHVIGRALSATVLGKPAAADESTLTVRAPEAFGAATGDVIELDVVPRVEHGRVAGVAGDVLWLDAPLRFDHAAQSRVARLERAPTATPAPASFPFALREGPELVLQAGVRAGETWLEIDSLSGIRAGDTLRVEDAERTEDVRLSELPREDVPPPAVRPSDLVELADLEPGRIEYLTVATVRGANVDLTAPPRYDHAAGTRLRCAGAVTATAALTAAAPAGARVLELPRAFAAGLNPGHPLTIGAGEHARVERVRDTAATLAAPLRSAYDAGAPVVARERDVRRVSAVLGARAAAGRARLVIAEHAGGTRRAALLAAPLQHHHDAGVPLSVATPGRGGAGTAFLHRLAGWIGLALRPDRGERWNRELLRLAGRIWPWRGTPRGIEAFLAASLRGEAERVRVVDAPNPMQVGLVSTLGVDAVIGGMLPHYFLVDIDTEPRNSRLYSPVGLREMVQAAHAVLRAERPAHTYYDLRVNAHTTQIGVDARTEIGARVGDTTLLWSAPQVVEGDR